MPNTRISFQSVVRSAMAQVRQATTNALASQEQLATARRINRPSDAPLDAAHVQRLRAYQTRLGQYERNLNHADSEIEFAAATLMETTDLLVQAREIAVEGANAHLDAGGRRALANQVDEILDGLLTRANATFNGRYIFAGTATDTEPFEIAPGAAGADEAVYHGDPNYIELPVSPRITVRTNEPGSAVFLGPRPSDTSAFDALIRLRDALRGAGGQEPARIQREVSDCIGGITEAHDRVTEAAGRLGCRAALLVSSRVSLENADLTTSELLSSLEDTNFAETAVQLYGQEAALEAAMAIAKRMLGHSLLEYLE